METVKPISIPRSSLPPRRHLAGSESMKRLQAISPVCSVRTNLDPLVPSGFDCATWPSHSLASSRSSMHMRSSPQLLPRRDAEPAVTQLGLMSRLSALQEKLDLVQNYHEALLHNAGGLVRDGCRREGEKPTRPPRRAQQRAATSLQSSNSCSEATVHLEDGHASSQETLAICGVLQDMWQQQQRLKEEHQTKVSRLEQHVNQLEQALLMQTKQRERDLLMRYKELDIAEDELYVKNIGVQQAASRAAALAAASSFADAGCNPASCSRDRPYTGPDNLSVALPPNRRHACPPPCSWAGEASFPALESQLEPAPRGAGKAVHDPLLPLVPDVYKAAVSIILEHGWDALHGGDNSGPAWTVLHWAASEGRGSLCELLLQAGADPGHCDESMKQPWHYAEENGHAELSKRLMQKAIRSATDSQPRPHDFEGLRGGLGSSSDSVGLQFV